MLPLASAGCLITDHRSFQEVDYPPSILPSVSSMYLPNKVNVVRTDVIGGGDAGPSALTWEVVVSDPNVDQPLRVVVFLNRSATYTGGPNYMLPRVAPNGSVARDPVPVSIPLGELVQDGHAHCIKVEVLVSSDFSVGRTPTKPGDVAEMTWYFLGTTASETDVSMGDCP